MNTSYRYNQQIEGSVETLPVLTVSAKPNARSSFLLSGTGGRNIALCWSRGEAEEIARRVNSERALATALCAVVALSPETGVVITGRPLVDAIEGARAALREAGIEL